MPQIGNHRLLFLCAVLVGIALAGSAHAADLQAGVVDCGGRCVQAAAIVLDGSLGGLGGTSSAAGDTAIHGYIGQLTEVAGLTLTSTPMQVDEGGTAQLAGVARMEDDSVTVLSGREILWTTVVYPLAGISVDGVLTTAAVYADTSGDFSGSYLGKSANGTLIVLNSNPDNYGSYAADGLPDSWQMQYFGIDNPAAAPSADVTGSGQNNLFKYVAGLDPTNAASVFSLRLEPVPGDPDRWELVVSPYLPDRHYTVMWQTNLLTGVWEPLTNAIEIANGTEHSFIDPGIPVRSKVYRIRITYP